jgi:hypothetical protein
MSELISGGYECGRRRSTGQGWAVALTFYAWGISNAKIVQEAF